PRAGLQDIELVRFSQEGRRPQPLSVGASWQNGSEWNSALFALQRIEPNASWFLRPPSCGLLHQRLPPFAQAQPAHIRVLELILFFSLSWEDCPGAPNSRWRWAC